MAEVRAERCTAEIDGDFVVFLIGMRINRFWKPHKWLPVAAAMPRMLAELARTPELGLLHARTHFGFPDNTGAASLISIATPPIATSRTCPPGRPSTRPSPACGHLA
jgi:hypothetical protein